MQTSKIWKIFFKKLEELWVREMMSIKKDWCGIVISGGLVVLFYFIFIANHGQEKCYFNKNTTTPIRCVGYHFPVKGVCNRRRTDMKLLWVKIFRRMGDFSYSTFCGFNFRRWWIFFEKLGALKQERRIGFSRNLIKVLDAQCRHKTFTRA